MGRRPGKYPGYPKVMTEQRGSLDPNCNLTGFRVVPRPDAPYAEVRYLIDLTDSPDSGSESWSEPSIYTEDDMRNRSYMLFSELPEGILKQRCLIAAKTWKRWEDFHDRPYGT